jgi:hypothetical protein
MPVPNQRQQLDTGDILRGHVVSNFVLRLRKPQGVSNGAETLVAEGNSL